MTAHPSPRKAGWLRRTPINSRVKRRKSDMLLSVPSRPAHQIVNASLKFPENQRFEIVGFLALLGRILWFDPRREHSSIPTANSRSRRAQGLSRLAASSRPPAGLGLDWPEHGGILNRIGSGGAHHIIGKFKPLVLGE